MEYVKINPVEVSSILAHQSTIDELVIPTQTDGEYSIYESEDDLMEEGEDETLYYKEEVQDVFNRWYDYYFGILTDNHIE